MGRYLDAPNAHDRVTAMAEGGSAAVPINTGRSHRGTWQSFVEQATALQDRVRDQGGIVAVRDSDRERNVLFRLERPDGSAAVAVTVAPATEGALLSVRVHTVAVADGEVRAVIGEELRVTWSPRRKRFCVRDSRRRTSPDAAMYVLASATDLLKRL